MTEDELMLKWPTLYCIMQCHKIGHFVKLVYDFEIVRMNVEFQIDVGGQVWLFHCSDIWIREANERIKNYDKMFSQFIFAEM